MSVYYRQVSHTCTTSLWSNASESKKLVRQTTTGGLRNERKPGPITQMIQRGVSGRLMTRKQPHEL